LGDKPKWKTIAESLWGLVSSIEEPQEINIRIETLGSEVSLLLQELIQCSFSPGKYIRYEKEVLHSLHIYNGWPADGGDWTSWQQALAVGTTLTNIKELVVTPPNLKTPLKMAQLLEGAAPNFIHANYLDMERLPLIAAVGKSSSSPCCAMKFEYRPFDHQFKDERFPHVVLVGKGVTFDTGGLCLKPEAYMTDMKNDMTGAAMAAHICFLACQLKLKVKVTALVGLAENLLDGNGMRPSDVYTSRNGKTVEISDTDAEGRLLLGDLLAFACELKPDAIIDMATLTGAAVSALGGKINTVLTNSDELWSSIEFAAKEADEKVWRLPLDEVYEDALKSKVADLKNYGEGPGAITAGLFLKEFVTEGIKWAHFDLSAAGDSADEPTAAGTLTVLKLLTHL
jgi:leucyl aminopeptidase